MPDVETIWQPILGCSPASIGCANCFSMKLAGAGDLAKESKAGSVWTGEVRLNEAELAKPTTWESWRQVYVCPHGDLFHESAPDAWLDRIFDVIDRCRQHTFVVLTKRAARQRDYVARRYPVAPCNVMFGVSAERQIEAEARVSMLLQTPAIMRFLTLYPLLGPVDLYALLGRKRLAPEIAAKALSRRNGVTARRRNLPITIVQAGEEPQRPADPEWTRKIADDCALLGIRFSRGGRLVGMAG